jgi:hypothetical protein
LFLVDTGVGGTAFSAPTHVLDRLGVPHGPPTHGRAGAGSLTTRSLSIARLSLGGLERRDVSALAGLFPPALEHGLGFAIGGLIGHEFFRGVSLTFDFTRMCLRVADEKSRKP